MITSHNKQKLEKSLPQHVGIIMDGNGRWAKMRGLPRQAGHQVGAKTFRQIVSYCNQIGLQYLTVYAFSTENWKRPPEEIRAIIELLKEYLIDAPRHTNENVQVQFIGDLTSFDDDLLALMQDCEEKSRLFTGLHLNIAINYGGRHELVSAFQRIHADLLAGNLFAEQICEETVEQYLYTKGQPAVDLIVRPSGEYRLSNFMIWQAAYAEYVFFDRVMWPDFKHTHIDKALKEYAKRNRRFGEI